MTVWQVVSDIYQVVRKEIYQVVNKKIRRPHRRIRTRLHAHTRIMRAHTRTPTRIRDRTRLPTLIAGCSRCHSWCRFVVWFTSTFTATFKKPCIINALIAMAYGLVTLVPPLCYVLCYALLCFTLLCSIIYIHAYTCGHGCAPAPATGGGVGYKHQAPSQSAPYRLNIRENLSPKKWLS